ncbi:MAG: lipopolysaccharide biosynthesis protein [Bacteroidales bacterium]|nr:lipopolysaccharide biosynthesis protein [Bacteroidales bacterium]
MPLVKNRVLKATVWSFFQRAGSLIIGFVTNMVLARLLEPEDFGCVAIILVFVSFADILVDSGLTSALIQKKDVSKQDISTVFSTNLFISIILFATIFIAAPAIGRFVGVPNLAVYLRVESIAVLIRAFYCIQAAFLNKNLKFSSLAKIGITSATISASISIAMAALGCGVWSLVAKNLILQLSICLLYRHTSKVSYELGFYKKNFKELFGFGWSVALTSFCDTFYSNIVSFLIGKRYSVKDLGYYNQANSLKQIPVYSISMVISQVLFPFMSKMQDDSTRVLNNTRRVLVATTFFTFPLLVYLFFFAKPVIILLYSSKWVASAVYFQILCIGGLVNAIIHINRNVLKSIGETKTIFFTQIIITIMGLIGVAYFLRYDIKILVIWIVCTSYINWLLISIMTGRKIGYSLWMQCNDLFLNILFSIIAGYVSYRIGLLIANEIVTALIGALLFAVIYFLLHFIFKTKQFKTVLSSNK